MRHEIIVLSNTDCLVDLSEPSFAGLSYLLRHHEGRWDYGNICYCAIGLGSQAWGIAPHEVEKALHAENKAAMEVFVDAGRRRNLEHKDVTREMVAEDIDACTS